MECKKKGNWEVGNGEAMMTEQWGEGYKGRGIGILYILLLQVLSHFLPTFSVFLCLEPSVTVITASNTDLIITSVSNWTIDNGNFHYPQTLWRTIIFVINFFLLSKYDLKNTEIVIR